MTKEGNVNNAANPSQVKRARKIERTRAHIDRDDLVWLLSDRRGRRIYWKWLSKTNPFNTSMDDRGNEWTNYNEGRRSIGLKMLEELNNVKPEAYAQMLNEERNERFLQSDSANRKVSHE